MILLFSDARYILKLAPCTRVWRMEATSNGHLSKIVFISTTSLKYNYIVMEDDAI